MPILSHSFIKLDDAYQQIFFLSSNICAYVSNISTLLWFGLKAKGCFKFRWYARLNLFVKSSLIPELLPISFVGADGWHYSLPGDLQGSTEANGAQKRKPVGQKQQS